MKKRFRFTYIILLTTFLDFSSCWAMEKEVWSGGAPMDCGQESSPTGGKRQRDAEFHHEKRGEENNLHPFKRIKTEDRFEEDEIKAALPNEVWINLLSFLSAQDLCSISKVCRFFNSLSEDNFLWRGLGQRERIGDVQNKLEYAVRRYPGIPSKYFLNLAKRFPATPFTKISLHFLADMGANGESNSVKPFTFNPYKTVWSQEIASCILTAQNRQGASEGSVSFPILQDDPMFFLDTHNQPLFIEISYENLPINLSYKFSFKQNISLVRESRLHFSVWKPGDEYRSGVLRYTVVDPNITYSVNPLTEESFFNNSPMAKNLYLRFGRESKVGSDHEIILNEYRKDLFSKLDISDRLAKRGIYCRAGNEEYCGRLRMNLFHLTMETGKRLVKGQPYYYDFGKEEDWEMVRDDLLTQLMKADYLCYYGPGDEESWNIASNIHRHIFPALYKYIPFKSKYTHTSREEFTKKYKHRSVALEARLVRSVIPYIKNKKYLSALDILYPYIEISREGAYSAQIYAQAAYALCEYYHLRDRDISEVAVFNRVLHYLALAWELNPHIFTSESVTSPELDKKFSADIVVTYLDKYVIKKMPCSQIDETMAFIIGYHCGVRNQNFQVLANNCSIFAEIIGNLWPDSHFNGAYSNTSLLLKQADNLRQIGKYKESLTVIKKFLRFDSDERANDCHNLLNIKTSFYSQSYLLAADILMELGQYKDASSYYEKHINRHSLPVNQDSLILYGKWGEAALRAQNWSQATRIFEGIISFLKEHNLSLSKEMYSQAYEAFFNEGWKK